MTDEMPVNAKGQAAAAPTGNGWKPKPRRQSIRPRGSLIAALDIGTSKISCFIARVEAAPRVLGIGRQISRGVRNGTIVDVEAAGTSVGNAVHAAEEMAGETIEQVVANLSGGFFGSRIVKAEVGIAGREITDAEMQRVLQQGHLMREPGDRHVIHSVPVAFSIDDSRGIRDPRGMFVPRRG